MTNTPSSLLPFITAGALTSAEVQLVRTVASLQPEADLLSLLALAVASRGVRLGHACIDLGEISELDSLLSEESPQVDRDRPEPPWPDSTEWVAALRKSPIVASPDTYLHEPLRPLVLDHHRLYLQRYFSHEIRVATEINQRAAVHTSTTGLDGILDELFGSDPDRSDPQRHAAEIALGGGLTIITGGPGTGKTYTIARLLAGATRLAAGDGRAVAIALAAPTGRAAARITESVAGALVDTSAPPVATTIHALLGWAPGDGFRHNRGNPLPHDLVIIDETSMISLSLMASLFNAIRPDAAVVLVGDPDQLASVEVGTVLSDIVRPARVATSNEITGPARVATSNEITGPARVATSNDAERSQFPLSTRIVRLSRVHRFGEESDIASLAAAVRAGDEASALELLSSDPRGTDGQIPVIEWVRPEQSSGIGRVMGEVIEASASVAEAALAGDAAKAVAASLDTKVLAATRMNQFGLYHWSDLIESSVVARVPGIENSRRWFVGRPVMITANDRVNRVANGDTGIVVARRGGLSVAMADGDGHSVRYLPTSRLSEVESWWAMTIHKSQGSEFRHVVVSLPPAGSPILTRELLYTAITRARERVTIVATEAALRGAIGRGVSRASGLGSRLWPNEGVASG